MAKRDLAEMTGRPTWRCIANVFRQSSRQIVRQLRQAKALVPARVHELRVAIRRALAAIQLCSPDLPRSHCKRLKRKLQALRHRLGTLRDADVMLLRLQDWQLAMPPSVHRILSRRITRRRDMDELAVVQWLCDARIKKITSAFRRIIKWLRGQRSRPPKWRLLIRRTIRKPLGRLRSALASERTVRQRQPDRHTLLQALHQGRIACKQIRYTLELTESCRGKRQFDNITKTLRRTQQRIGVLLDSVATYEQLEAWAASRKRMSERTWLGVIRAGELQRIENAFQAADA